MKKYVGIKNTEVQWKPNPIMFSIKNLQNFLSCMYFNESKNNNTQQVFGKSQDNFVGNKLDKKYPITLLTYSKSSQEDMKYHNSQKPVELLEYLINTYTKPRRYCFG